MPVTVISWPTLAEASAGSAGVPLAACAVMPVKPVVSGRARLTHQQNIMSRRIYNQKHDAQRQDMHPRTEIGQRKENQQRRIGEGIENGSLTPREASRLERKEAALNRETRQMRAENGGTLTPAEKAKVNRQQNRLSHDIYREKHDRQHR